MSRTGSPRTWPEDRLTFQSQARTYNRCAQYHSLMQRAKYLPEDGSVFILFYGPVATNSHFVPHL